MTREERNEMIRAMEGGYARPEDFGPSGSECYRIVAEELDVPVEARAATLASLNADVIERAKRYAKRSHKRWPPRPATSGWRFVRWSI